MGDFLVAAYPWVKSLHVIAVISWMVGMLYLPRLFVYHADSVPASDKSETFKVMERRLLYAIMNPAMIATFVFGGLLLGTPGVVDWTAHWIWIKLAAVAAMTFVHGVYIKWVQDFRDDANTRPARAYRIANEVPTILLVLIVVMVIARPF
ncbi:MAG: TIGR00701 family protein [Alphaproteobacteria bacterium]|nr:TIGR00701 family protein [Alphaproteobacteria bacterium]HCP00353.1 protoporphyrinogen oxidase HemJ [Rhodospirillaceae bacterium]